EFQKYALAAETMGVEQDKLADIFKDVNDKAGDFLNTGGGALKDFFDNVAPKVGVTADEFRKLSGPQALGLYVSSLEKAGASQQDMTFYLEAIASDATALLP
ncbi:phage tail tape measure protein, partial [Pseudomonas aeruginosa]